MNEIAYGIGEATDEKMTFSFSTEGMHKPITNGDIIMAMFPTIDTYFSNVIDMKLWWNAKYKGTGEIQCNHTDEEIAKSFIKDVEAVKDLLPKAESEG